MQYIYTVYGKINSDLIRVDTPTDKFADVVSLVSIARKKYGNFQVVISDELNPHVRFNPLETMEDMDEWWSARARDYAWADPYRSPDVEAKISSEREELVRKLNKTHPGTSESTDHAYTRASVSMTDPINPSHYQDIVPGMQFFEMMQYMLVGKRPVEAGALVHMYSYLMRNGKKGDALEDYKKARWYLNFLIAYLENNCQPIKIDAKGNVIK